MDAPGVNGLDMLKLLVKKSPFHMPKSSVVSVRRRILKDVFAKGGQGLGYDRVR